MPRKYPKQGTSLLGKRIGKLVVVRLYRSNPKNWLTKMVCRCDCGRTCTASIGSLSNGRPGSCGCAPRSNFVDRTGGRYGHLVVVRLLKKKDKWGQLLYECKCDCGNFITVIGNRLKQKQVDNCGCLHADRLKEAGKKRRTHGMSYTRLYEVWRGMIQRCNVKSSREHSYHAAMGVRVCARWKKSASSFLRWALDNGYRTGLTLDRYPDPNGDYKPGNCRWATRSQQQRNRRDTLRIRHKGKSYTLPDIAEEYSINQDTLRDRIQRGWPMRLALTLCPDRTRRVINAR